MVRGDVKMDRQLIYLVRSGMVRATIPVQDTTKKQVKQVKKAEKKVKVRRINRNTKKWREFRKRSRGLRICWRNRKEVKIDGSNFGG